MATSISTNSEFKERINDFRFQSTIYFWLAFAYHRTLSCSLAEFADTGYMRECESDFCRVLILDSDRSRYQYNADSRRLLRSLVESVRGRVRGCHAAR